MDNMYNENYQPDNSGASAPAGGKKKTTVLVAVGLVLALLMGILGSAIGNSLFGKGSTTI